VGRNEGRGRGRERWMEGGEGVGCDGELVGGGGGTMRKRREVGKGEVDGWNGRKRRGVKGIRWGARAGG